ncbi:hypothetical protein PghCCS26_37700 [Paenibacillus glycanilyticus]|uniref:Nucleotidyltransferase family protein n=1 Tax=Paenibacillus glycanilyticus TaxID=126569 RepID=A0ABQ6NNG3_9BACL|nr:nucleotidyltransferase family protein [Paenibacillus glycanilyticus]GMK46641.1 hypothetical protein PghCCS26_37700 [Paenibacillus glycanilyticus]
MSQPAVLDISSFSNELRFLLRLLRSDLKLETEEAARLAKDLDWESFLRHAVYHEIYPVIYPMLIQLNYKFQWTPVNVLAELKALYSQNTVIMLQLSGELELINALLEEQGIRPLFLRGPFLAAMLYDDISGSTSGELEILVAEMDCGASVQQLLSAGYTSTGQCTAEALHNECKTYYASYIHQEKKIKLNLYWNRYPEIVNGSTFEELWTRRQVISKDKRVYTLGKEDLLFDLIMHGTRHGWSSLKWLQNIDRMMSQFLNWNRMNQLFEMSRTRLLGGEAFILATQLLGTLLPEEAHVMTHEPKSRRLAQMVLPFIREELNLYPKPERTDIGVLFNRYSLMTMSFKQKLLYKANKPYLTLKKEFRWSQSLFFLYLTLRPFLWFRRQMKRQTPRQKTS